MSDAPIDEPRRRTPEEIEAEHARRLAERAERLAAKEAAEVEAWRNSPAANPAWEPGVHGTPKWNWDLVRRRYVEGYQEPGGDRWAWPTLEQVADWSLVPLATIRNRSGEEGWREKRSQHQATIERQRGEDRARQLAKEADELDTSAVTVAKLGVGLVHARLLEIAKQAADGKAAGRTGISVRELEEAARAADLFHRIGLRGLGAPELQRVEITGANGQPIEIAHELRRDNPERLVAVLSVLHEAGIDLGIEDPDEEGSEARYPAAIEVGG